MECLNGTGERRMRRVVGRRGSRCLPLKTAPLTWRG